MRLTPVMRNNLLLDLAARSLQNATKVQLWRKLWPSAPPNHGISQTLAAKAPRACSSAKIESPSTVPEALTWGILVKGICDVAVRFSNHSLSHSQRNRGSKGTHHDWRQGTEIIHECHVPRGKSATQMWVSTTIRIPLETLELLRDVSLARSFAELSTETKTNNEVTTKKEVSLSSVITELVEKNRAALEHEAEMVSGPGKK